MAKRLHTTQRARSGFSMLEVMIALSILAVGIIGVMATQITAMKLSGDSRVKTQAAYLAQQQIETIRAMDPGDVLDLVDAVGYPNDPNNPIDPNPNDGQDVTFVRRWVVEEDTPEAGVIQVTVEVDWPNRLGATRTVRLRTMIADS